MNQMIVIEGTDCSGKETQAKLLVDHFMKDGIPTYYFSFPHYDSPTGKIIGGTYLGKKEYGDSVFKEGAVQVDSKVASLYYAADRKYNLPVLRNLLSKGNLILNRYVESNMAHQGAKIKSKRERLQLYKWLENLEYKLLELPRPDITIFLYVPYEFIKELKKNRLELDQHEINDEYLKKCEDVYLELSNLRHYHIIQCVENGKLRSIEDIHQEIYGYIKEKIN